MSKLAIQISKAAKYPFKHLRYTLVPLLILPVTIRIISINYFHTQIFEFVLEMIWMLELVPAIVIPYQWGLKAGLATACFLWFTGVVVEGVLLVAGYNLLHLFFHGVVTLTFVAFVAVITGLLADRFQRWQDELHKITNNLAVLEERRRIGRELHDTAAQTLPALKLKLLLAIQELETQPLQTGMAQLNELLAVLEDEIKNIRCSIADIKLNISADKSIYLLFQQCLEMARRYYGLQIEVRMLSNMDIVINANVKIQLVRIVQEALTNVRKHAGINKVYFHLYSEKDILYIKIEDHGCGFSMNQKSPGDYGLASMRERAELINAMLEINSTPGAGTTVVIAVPINQGEVSGFEPDPGVGGR